MAKKIYVGNLLFKTTEEDVRKLFQQHGTVESVTMITDRNTGRFRGFCFVEMKASEADSAIQALDGKEVNGRKLRVSEARQRKKKDSKRGGKRSGNSGENYRARGDFPNSGGARDGNRTSRGGEAYRARDHFPHSGGGRGSGSGGKRRGGGSRDGTEIYRARDDFQYSSDSERNSWANSDSEGGESYRARDLLPRSDGNSRRERQSDDEDGDRDKSSKQ